MILNFQYTADDFQEAAAAQTAFFSGNNSGRRTKKTRRSLFGWILFVVLAVVWVFLLGRRNNARVPTVVAPEIIPSLQATQSFWPTLLSAMVAPSLTMAFLAWTFSKGAAIGRVPFYKPVMEATGRWRIILKGIALVSTLIGICAIVAYETAPSEPDWRPAGQQLFLVHFGPWLAWLIALILVVKIWQKRLTGRLGHAESSARMPQRLEIADTRVVLSMSMQQHEFAWSYFVSYLESKNLLVLFTRDLGMIIVPKRAFESEELLLNFCGILQNRISDGQFLPRESRFAVGPAVVAPVPVLPVNQKSNPPSSLEHH